MIYFDLFETKHQQGEIMLSSIILSLAMSTSPTVATDTSDFIILEAGRKRGDRISFQALSIDKTGRKRGDRIDFQALSIEKAGRKRGDRIDFQALSIEKTGRKRGDRINY